MGKAFSTEILTNFYLLENQYITYSFQKPIVSHFKTIGFEAQKSLF
ncbi:hypothetical protein HMPREF9296_0703 [Prevotella disiens FB035-09AN]|uniref:Uncharacterized protein n=1 Tax=Prevotella disiens FB035-09AN TaxID=866771 RepID=E1KUM1_9BACT|nr:hypothetical protein HMPREF9296_0703 [Prevotella disiens FB035-09AN]